MIKCLLKIELDKNDLTQKQLSELTGLKDDRSIMRPFGFTSRKKFVKELLKMYAEQV